MPISCFLALEAFSPPKIQTSPKQTQSCPPQLAVVEAKSERLNQMKPGSSREPESRDIPSFWWDLRFDQYKIKHTPKTKKAPQGSRRFFRREGNSLPAANLSSLAP